MKTIIKSFNIINQLVKLIINLLLLHKFLIEIYGMSSWVRVISVSVTGLPLTKCIISKIHTIMMNSKQRVK